MVISAVLLAETLAPMASQAIMSLHDDVWLPLFASPAIAVAGSLLLVFIPETLHLGPRSRPRTRQLPGPPLRPQAEGSSSSVMAFENNVAALGCSFKTTAALFGQRHVACLTPAAALAVPLSTVSLSLALRYLPARYGWTLGEAGVALSARTGLSIVVLLGLLPLLAYPHASA